MRNPKARNPLPKAAASPAMREELSLTLERAAERLPRHYQEGARLFDRGRGDSESDERTRARTSGFWPSAFFTTKRRALAMRFDGDKLALLAGDAIAKRGYRRGHGSHRSRDRDQTSRSCPPAPRTRASRTTDGPDVAGPAPTPRSHSDLAHFDAAVEEAYSPSARPMGGCREMAGQSGRTRHRRRSLSWSPSISRPS